MKDRYTAVALLGAGLALCAHAAPVPVRVTGSRVNLRARPDMNVEVVGQVGVDAVLMAKSFQSDWVEIIPPLGTSVWLHRDFVSGNRVTASELNVRAGPGVNYSIVGTLERNAPVVPREEFGEWIRIDAPESSSFWIHIQYVERVQPPSQLTVRRPEPPPPEPDSEPEAVSAGEDLADTAVAAPPPKERESTPATQPGSASAPDEPDPKIAAFDRTLLAERRLVPLSGQGAAAEHAGVLRASPLLQRNVSKYRLVTDDDSVTRVVCYVLGNRKQLDDLMGRRMRIQGREYWVQESPYPVIIPESILLDPGS